MSKKIILFDGVCNLCNHWVNFVIKRDKKDQFRFAALQEETGKKILIENGIDPNKFDSIILIENGKAYMKSTAALRIARRLGSAYPLTYIFILIPPFMRNWIYDVVGRNRYKWYGKKDSCMIPTPDLRKKFL